jgi:methylmalonyl-CoA mutase
LFQNIEANGGLLAQILAGKIQKMASESWAKRQNNLAGHNELLTGVSSFPDLDESIEGSLALKGDDESISSDENALKDYKLRIDDLSTFINAATQAASSDDLSSVFSAESTMCDALEPHSLGEAYESLRELSDRWLGLKGRRPQALLACLGPPSEFTQRVVFSKNYLAVGGIKATEAYVDIATIASAISDSKADLVVVCSSDKVYLESLNSIVEILKLNKTRLIVLAGHPGKREVDLKRVGVDLFIYSGDNMLKTLLEIAENIGMVE